MKNQQIKISTSFSLDPRILHSLKSLKITNYSKFIRHILSEHFLKTRSATHETTSVTTTDDNNLSTTVKTTTTTTTHQN